MNSATITSDHGDGNPSRYPRRSGRDDHFSQVHTTPIFPDSRPGLLLLCGIEDGYLFQA